jgi:adenosylcobinamide kinase/adenosylcobinamide-phosphate guanylyltransferase
MAASAERVCYIATLLPGDDPEMLARVERHRAARPHDWQTIVEPLALADAIEHAAQNADLVLVDCLTLWISNLSWEHRNSTPDQVEEAARCQVQRIAECARSSSVILVSNEVGFGPVPESPVTRAFRDAQGRLNQWVAEAAEEVIFVVAGLPLYLKRPEERR